jgi:hypothetical protein
MNNSNGDRVKSKNILRKTPVDVVGYSRVSTDGQKRTALLRFKSLKLDHFVSVISTIY